MSRQYEFTFHKDDETFETVTALGYGNTLRSAERSARGRLRDLGKDPKRFYRVGVGRFIKP